MRWARATGNRRFRATARRRTGIVLLVLALGFLLFLDWSGAAPQPVLAPEAGGHAWEVNEVFDAGTRQAPRRERPAGAEGSGGAQAAGASASGPPTAKDRRSVPQQPLANGGETNPLNLLVDGPGFIRFLGFTAISLGFAVVVLVFFWSHRRDRRL